MTGSLYHIHKTKVREWQQFQSTHEIWDGNIRTNVRDLTEASTHSRLDFGRTVVLVVEVVSSNFSPIIALARQGDPP